MNAEEIVNMKRHEFKNWLLESDLPQHLYKVEVLHWEALSEERYNEFFEKFPGREEFFYPSYSRIYRSLSGAKERAALLESCGASVAIYHVKPDWQVYESKSDRLARLERENAELKAQLGVA